MVNIAILGFGVVGSGVYEVIKKNCESITKKVGKKINVKYILDIRDFSTHEAKDLFVKDFETILNDESVEIVAEVIGGAKFAYDCTKAALKRGKNVVTSNKELVAKHGYELLSIAKENNVKYYFEASVGGGIPIIRPLKTCLAANEINEITGILNGTTNYILSQMIVNNKTFEVALKEAQANGYAESDPTADIEGHDACRKICILASLVSGKHIDESVVNTVGITSLTLEDVEYATKLGYVVKLLGDCKISDDGIFAEVSPSFVPKSHPLAPVDDVFNAVFVNGDAVGDVLFYGRGAGKLPTASAVVADIIDIAKNDGSDNSLMWVKDDNTKTVAFENSVKKYFVRVKTNDKNKTLADIKNTFSNATTINIFDNEVGFITESMSEKEIGLKLKELDVTVVSKLKVI